MAVEPSGYDANALEVIPIASSTVRTLHVDRVPLPLPLERQKLGSLRTRMPRRTGGPLELTLTPGMRALVPSVPYARCQTREQRSWDWHWA